MRKKYEEKDVDSFLKEAGNTEKNVQAQKRYTEFRGRRAQERSLWDHWDANGRKAEHLEPLLQSLDPLIQSETNKRIKGLGGSIAAPALKQELRNAAVRAIETFNPNKGAQLSTHVVGNFKRVSDFVTANRNTQYMAKEKTDMYQTFENARKELVERTGREPTALEMQQELPHLKLKTIRELQRGFAPEAYTEMGDEIDTSRGDPLSPREAFLMMKSQLNEQQRAVGDLHFTAADEPSLRVPEIAKRLGMPVHRVYHIKSQVQRLIAPVLKKE